MANGVRSQLHRFQKPRCEIKIETGEISIGIPLVDVRVAGLTGLAQYPFEVVPHELPKTVG